MDGDVLRAPDQLMWQRPPEQLADEAPARATDHDLGDIFKLGKAQDLGRHVGRRQRLGLGSEALCERHSFIEPSACLLGERRARPLDRNRDPRCIHQVGEPLGRAHHARRTRIGTDAGQNAFAGSPWPFDRLRLHASEQIRVDSFRRASQGELAQCREILWFEEILNRAGRGVLNVDLALGQALEQLIRRKIDQHDLVGLVENRVGYGLAHAHCANLLYDIIEALEVLDVKCRPDVDPDRQEFVDILPSLRMPAAGDVRVGKFIDQQQLRTACKRGVEIKTRA
jgi:hypothetical protein